MKPLLKIAFAVGLLGTPGLAHAQMNNLFVSPYVGATTNGSDLGNDGAGTVGVAAGWMGSVWGFEADLAKTPDFFLQDGFRINRRVTTVMGNVLVAVPIMRDSSFKIHGSVGAGVIKPRLTEAGAFASIDVDQPGFNAGIGATWIKTSIGIRGDLRYFRSFGDEEDDLNAFGLEVSKLDFVRATIGLVARF